MSTLETLQRLKKEAFCGALGNSSPLELAEYAAALCHPKSFEVFNTHEFPQISETVRIHLLRAHIESLQNHVIELHNHITGLNAGNTKIQKWVIALAIASLIGTVIQVTAAVRSELRAEPLTRSSSPLLQPSISKAVTPSHSLPLSSCSAKVKNP